ncbi:hypothetical protein QUF61_10480 [Candidatus Venteria ishoeyi]|uniref:hypothetical protein n=1 Tax=Candidatus Venteria ishoeyi TaxID=1899563 RepID=UPI0025A5E053|nr:hypothetical protein [Candidatus Venteria ishoeyi]MDM8546909.1 hypothetical protein [Candidatus Venteria ishoeyi]
MSKFPLSSECPPWIHLFRYLRHKRIFIFIILGLLGMELLLQMLLPRILNDNWYLRMYLPWEAIKQTERFLADKRSLEIDAVLGWKNRANSYIKSVHYDHLGSRSTANLDLTQRKTKRVVFIGDSRINGHLEVDNNQTINAYLESPEIETFNFGSAMYHLDQSYLMMQKRIPDLRPEVVVIGLGSKPGYRLSCHYLPFHSREETVDMPFIKPRFLLKDGELSAQIPPYQKLLEKLPNNPLLPRYLKQYDPCYTQFKQFKRWESTPLLGFITKLKIYLQKMQIFTTVFTSASSKTMENRELVIALLRGIQQFASQHQVQVIFLLFPRSYEYSHQAHDGQTDYAQTRDILQQLQLTYIDVQQLLGTQSDAVDYYTDSVHFTATTNHLIANALSHHLQ